jgi:RimJ/RimL family protein N-acetyltransferase
VVRPASADDLEAVRDLHGLPDARLRRLLSPAGGVCLVAEEADEIVATASVVVEGDVGEISVLVDARWQRRGLGTALARRLLAWAGRNAVVALVAHVRSDDVAMLRTLRRLGGTSSGKDSGTIDVTLPVPAPALSEERVRTS